MRGLEKNYLMNVGNFIRNIIYGTSLILLFNFFLLCLFFIFADMFKILSDKNIKCQSYEKKKNLYTMKD